MIIPAQTSQYPKRITDEFQTQYGKDWKVIAGRVEQDEIPDIMVNILCE